MLFSQARRLLSCLSLLLILMRAEAAEAPKLPTWSKHFAKVSDPDVQSTLQSYRKQGWLNVFLDKGGHVSGKELMVNAQLARSDLMKAIAEDEEYLHRVGVSYAASRPSRGECATAVRGVVAAVCDEQRRSSELSAIEGLLELLPAYSPRLPAPPKSAHYGSVAGEEVARVQVVIGPAARAPRTIDVLATSGNVAAEVGDTLVVHLSMSDSTVASGVTVTPAFEVLQLPTGRRPGATRRYFAATAVKTGTATLEFFGPLLQAVEGALAVNWAGYVVPGGPFGFISGSWSVPAVYPDKFGMSAHWIGIDDASDALIQIGTESDYTSGVLGFGGGISYSTWFELLPAGSNDAGKKVFPGDQMFASITSIGPPLPGSNAPWKLVLQDLSPDNSWTFTTNQSFQAGKLATGEWVLEATTWCDLGCSVQPLPDLYPGVTFDSFNGKLQQLGFDAATAGGPGFTTSQAKKMNDPPARVATPSIPDLDADGFAVTLGPAAGLPPPPLLLIYALPNAAVGSAYSYDFDTSGVLYGGPVVWALPASNLPPGMQFANGTISGTPQGSGTYIVSLFASEAANYSAVMTQSVSLTVLSAWPGPPDFAVQPPPAIGLYGDSGGLPKPCSGGATFVVTPSNGFSGAVQFSVPTSSYRTVTFTPNPVQVGQVTASTTAMSIRFEQCPPVSSNLEVTAASGAISYSFKLPVNPPPPTCGTSGRPPCR
jgi:hypothetical protein